MASRELKAEDIFPLIEKLTPEEQARLAYYALRVRAGLAERTAARWDLSRLTPASHEEDLALASAGLGGWADELDREDGR